DVTGPSASTDGELAMFSGTSGKFIRRGGVLPSSYRLPRGWLAALKTSNNPVDQVNDIDIQDGECRDSTNTVDMVLPFGMTKRIDLPWAAGTDQGGLDATGTLANLSYHIFVIKNVNTTQVDCLFSPSATAPILPTGFTHFRRIASLMRRSGVLMRFLQEGDYFYKPAEVDTGVGDTIPGTASTIKTLQTIPIGIRGHAICSEMAFFNNDPAGGGTVTYMPGDVDLGGGAYGPYVDASANWFQTGYPILFNTSGQIRIRASAPATRMHLSTFGWIDPRGRND